MSKFVIIAVLVGILIFFIARRLMNIPLFAAKRIEYPGFIPIEADKNIVNRVINTTLGSVAIGFVLLIVILFLGIKVKIFLFLLPISFYLMGQLFLLANHINHTKRQRMWFNPKTNDILIHNKKQGNISINLYRDVHEVIEVRSIQKNRGILFGYFKLATDMGDVYIPFLYKDNQHNNFFFTPLQYDFQVKSRSVFFPMV